MRVLGIDPGSIYMGLGCVEMRPQQIICIGHQVVRVAKNSSVLWQDRAQVIFSSVVEAIEAWQADAVAIEKAFMAKNAQSALKLGQARGAAIAAVAMQNLSLFEYSPREIKQSLTTSGAAGKEQVQQMVEMLLGNSLRRVGPIERNDAADALAIAICHGQGFQQEQRVNRLRHNNSPEIDC